jgi:hypothetical protein
MGKLEKLDLLRDKQMEAEHGVGVRDSARATARPERGVNTYPWR